jgi:hypothetical protein
MRNASKNVETLETKKKKRFLLNLITFNGMAAYTLYVWVPEISEKKHGRGKTEIIID